MWWSGLPFQRLTVLAFLTIKTPLRQCLLCGYTVTILDLLPMMVVVFVVRNCCGYTGTVLNLVAGDASSVCFADVASTSYLLSAMESVMGKSY
jgi:hypothetical protein